jgi:hypothetical protein
MEKRPYQRQVSAWWESLETEADNLRVNPAIFRLPQQEPTLSFRQSSEPIEDCFIIKEAVQKLIQFLNSSHQAGCSDKTCRYDPKSCTVKVRVKTKNPSNSGFSTIKPIEFKLKKKRGRKSKYELQQIALLKAANGLNSY